MASLWQFFGLPNPDGSSSEKKPENQASAPLKQAATLQASKPSALTSPTVAPTLVPAPTPAENRLKSAAELQVNIKTPPPQWQGPVTAEGEAFHEHELQALLALAKDGIHQIFELQQKALSE